MRLIKAHAYGNDFLLWPATTGSATDDDLRNVVRRLCDRHRGVGADGFIRVEPTSNGARTELINADGSPAEVSGNGLRCVAAWLASERRLVSGADVVVHTAAGPKPLTLIEHANGRWTFRADMGQPQGLRQESIRLGSETVAAVLMSMGNPQCVVLGEVSDERLRRIGGPLAVHSHFREGTNVELATVESPTRVRILIWERGVGPTASSGTGACASAVAAAAYGGSERDLEVVSPGGSQHVEWTDAGVFLTGWAELVATIEMFPEA
jgi:diaminopimelate epimerase